MAIKKNANDVKYAQMMIPHHENAIVTSAKEFSKGENDDMKKFALDVFTAQKEQVAWLRKWLKSAEEPESGGGM